MFVAPVLIRIIQHPYYIVTNTTSTVGNLKELDAKQCWRTDAYDNHNLPQNGYSETITNRAIAPGYGKFPDGLYEIIMPIESFAKIKDENGIEIKPINEKKVIVDNFRPFIKQLKMKTTGQDKYFYNTAWEWKKIKGIYQYSKEDKLTVEDDIANSPDGSADVEIIAEFSEPMSLEEEGIPVLDFKNTELTATSTSDNKMLKWTINAAAIKDIFNEALNYDKTINVPLKFTGKDLAGTELFKPFTDENSGRVICDRRTSGGFQLPNDRVYPSDFYDKEHQLIIKPQKANPDIEVQHKKKRGNTTNLANFHTFVKKYFHYE